MSSNLHSLWESAGGNVPDHWEFKTIEELLENSKSISVGVMYPGQNTEDGVPLIRVSDVKNGAIASKPEFCISLKIDEEYKRTRLNGTELLITLVGTPGDCVIVTEEMAGWNAARALAVVRLADIEIRSWLRYVLLSKPARHLIDVRLNTTVQKTLNLKDIRELGIPIPPKHEREEIVKVIDSIESKSLINRQTNQTLEQIAQALFKSWFVDFDPVKAKIAAKQAGGTAEQIERAAMAAISGAVQGCTNVAGAGSAGATKTETELDQLEAQGRANAASTGCAEAASQYQNLKTTAALFPDELVDSELGEIPEGWKEESIYKICDVIYGAPFKSKLFNTDGNGIPLVRIRDLKNESPGVWTEEKHPKGYLIQNGDLIIGMDGEFKPYIWGGNEAWMNQRVCCFKPKNNLSSGMLREFIKKDLAHYESTATATTVIHLGKGDIDNFTFINPDQELLGIFDTTIYSLYKKIVACKLESINLASQRDALLPKLLTSELSDNSLNT